MRLLLTVLTTALLGITALAQQPTAAALTPRVLESLLAAKPQGAEAEQLAARIRTTFGADALTRGAAPRVDELAVAWAVELPQPPAAQARPPRVASDNGGFNLTL